VVMEVPQLGEAPIDPEMEVINIEMNIYVHILDKKTNL